MCFKSFRIVFQEIQCCVSGVKDCVSRVSVFCFMSFRVVFQEFTTVLLKPLKLINNVEDIFLVLKQVPAAKNVAIFSFQSY